MQHNKYRKEMAYETKLITYCQKFENDYKTHLAYTELMGQL